METKYINSEVFNLVALSKNWHQQFHKKFCYSTQTVPIKLTASFPQTTTTKGYYGFQSYTHFPRPANV